MATPTYQGDGQPIADNAGGWVGRFGSFFGGGTPAYQPAPVPKPTEPASEPTETAKAVGTCGPIAIIVPRQGCVSQTSEQSEQSEP